MRKHTETRVKASAFDCWVSLSFSVKEDRRDASLLRRMDKWRSRQTFDSWRNLSAYERWRDRQLGARLAKKLSARQRQGLATQVWHQNQPDLSGGSYLIYPILSKPTQPSRDWLSPYSSV